MLVKEFPESSNIAALAYDQPEARLYARFKGGTVYSYEGVPDAIWLAFMGRNAGSIGKLFYSTIRNGHYVYTKLQDDDVPKLLKSTHDAEVADSPDLPGMRRPGGGADRRSDRVQRVRRGTGAAAVAADGPGEQRAQAGAAAAVGVPPARPEQCPDCKSAAVVRASTASVTVYSCASCGWTQRHAVKKRRK